MNIQIEKTKIIFYWTDVMESMCFRNKTVFSCNGFISISFDAEQTETLT